jgi:D-alanyl-D-alanine carboxypeptidase/D-alanyl-D-alanine-endopeptidase (penicillin-binding protein 4)
VGVDTRYDDVRFVAEWPTSFHITEAGPLGALLVDDGMILGQQFKPDNPALAASQELTNLLVARGVSIAASPRHEPLPDDVPVIASVSSAPLTAVLKDMLVNSDNNTSELVIKEIGFAAKKSGTTVAGLQAVQEVLAKWKIKDVVMNDGSGLAISNRISCATFQKVLALEVDVFPSLLAIAGESGTIRDAFTDSSVKGRLVAKTGTLSGVKALTGYLTIANTEPVVFSLIMNETGIDNKTAYRPVWYALSDALNRAKSTPSLEELIP